MAEKSRQVALANGLDHLSEPGTRQSRTSRRVTVVARSVLFILAFLMCIHFDPLSYYRRFLAKDALCSLHDNDDPLISVVVNQCPAQYAIAPQSNTEITERNIKRLFPSPEFRNLSVKRLSGAVQIPTVSYDDNGPIGEDPRWDVFFDLERYFRETFPLL